MRSLLPLFVLGFALPALADYDSFAIPLKGDATVEILGGWRATPQHPFIADLERAGLNPQHSIFQPEGILSLGFAADTDFHVTIDVSYGLDSWQTSAGTAQVSMVGILLGADTPLYANQYFTIYAGGGLGYSLNTFTSAGQNTESNSSSGFLRAGVRVRLHNRVALVVEDRYVVSSALWPAFNSNVNVGGNLLSVGFLIHFFSPDDAGHPQEPTKH
jgi:opacity protein-like surface antigen